LYAPLLENLREEILEIDIDTLTPLEALMKLSECWLKRLQLNLRNRF
jgi:DNA mismatch repair protein MutS